MKPVRVQEDLIELDAKKGEHPFMHVHRGVMEDTGKPAFIVYIDGNKGGQIVGEGQNIAALVLPQKRMRALRDWLCEQDLGDF